MSCSKLGSSGPSSQNAFDGQNPFSEKQHPLLLPTVLDTIFPYLTFLEVKSNRLVCKTWAEVGIPFIGRRNLEPVKFSNVSHEDFLALKQEFQFQDQSKPHPKLKLFQGFALTWEEVGKMSYCNFMPSFKPREIIISGSNISNDPSINLNFFQPLMTTLTHLDLQIILDSSNSCRSSIDLLNNFSQLQPMTLKILCLEITADEDEHNFTREQLNAFFRAFEVVFQSQSPTLEELELEFKCVVSKTGNYQSDKIIKGIELPVFPSLQHLVLEFNIKETTTFDGVYNYLSIFVPFDFCLKFPQLVQLIILDSTLYTMKNDTFVLTRRHPFMKKLYLSEDIFNLDADENIDIFENLQLSFPYIEDLRIQNTPILYLQLGGIEISWVDTLRVLDCYGSRLDFNFGHLKKLEYLEYTLADFEINFEADDFPIAPFIEMLLEHHRQLPHLKRFHITYPGHIIPPEKMSQIREGLPEEFRAILTLD